MQRLGVHAAVISTLDYLPEPGLEAEAFQPHEAGKLAGAAAVLAETAAEARQRGLSFDYELPGPAAAGGTCRENIGRSLFVAADGAVSPCVYLNVPADAVDPRRRIFGNVNATNPIEIWESPEFSRFRERLAGGDPDPSCRTCPKRFMK
jgi:radical SAM protein with 4Fe4S-binding SPASM domain